MSLLRTTSEHQNYRELVVLLDATLKVFDGEDHEFYAQYNKSDLIRHVVLFYEDDQAVGCGAFKDFDKETVEVKRMFVLPEFRGRGIAGLILDELEKWARELSYSRCILETGVKQTSAVALYKRNGYKTIANYGPYEGIENSICMQKELINQKNLS